MVGDANMRFITLRNAPTFLTPPSNGRLSALFGAEYEKM
jgi:hypothetical protein